MQEINFKTVTLSDRLNQLPDYHISDGAEFGEIEEIDLHPVQHIGGGFLARNWAMIPHVTHHDDVDITDLEAYRKTLNAEATDLKISLPVLIAKALVSTLQKYPKFNASLDETCKKLRLKKFYNIGMAVDTPNGLLVPVIKGVDKKSIQELAQELNELAQTARSKGLPIDKMAGSSFTVSSIGALGGTGFTPIINAPDVAILGATKSTWKPVRGKNDEVLWRLMLPLSLSYDHRVINGADAAKFLRDLEASLNLLIKDN